MKIVQAIGWYYPETLGGTEVYVDALAQRLKSGGHEVLVAAPDAGGAGERQYTHKGVQVYRYPIPSSPTRAEAQGLVCARGAERFHNWLRRTGADVVHMHTFVTGLALIELRAAAGSGARVIVTSHAASLGFLCQRGTMMRWGRELCDGIAEPGKCAACALEAKALPRWAARLAARIPPKIGSLARGVPGRASTVVGMTSLIVQNQERQHEMFQTVDRFVVLTAWAERAVLANGAPRGKVSLNPLGIGNPRQQKPGPDQRPTRLPVHVGYVGRYDPIKGILDFARALASLPDSVPLTAEFRGPMRTDAERAVVREIRDLLGEDTRFTAGDEIAPAEVVDRLAQYDAVICPAACVEGGPTIALEAHSAGTPVIGTNIGGLAELVTDGVDGRLVQPGDWRALAAVLQTVASDPAGTIDSWRRRLHPPRTMDEVAQDYLEIYAA
jgi:glycosyltransferase involved in cell wall biosynthesis